VITPEPGFGHSWRSFFVNDAARQDSGAQGGPDAPQVWNYLLRLVAILGLVGLALGVLIVNGNVPSMVFFALALLAAGVEGTNFVSALRSWVDRS
jgi:hypothetical protein